MPQISSEIPLKGDTEKIRFEIFNNTDMNKWLLPNEKLEIVKGTYIDAGSILILSLKKRFRTIMYKICISTNNHYDFWEGTFVEHYHNPLDNPRWPITIKFRLQTLNADSSILKMDTSIPDQTIIFPALFRWRLPKLTKAQDEFLLRYKEQLEAIISNQSNVLP